MTEQKTEKAQACSATSIGSGGDTFACIWAEHGEEREHNFGIEHRVYGRHLAEHHDAEWLASEIRSLHVQIESMKRDQENDDTAARLRRLLGRLVQIAPANATRKTVALADVQAAWQEARS